jgi:dihydrofolate reductase
MGKVVLDISTSLDGFVAGPSPSLEEPLGQNGERLHEWVIGLASWRESHGLEGGEQNTVSDMVADGVASTGAVVMGRRMFSGGAGPWEEDPKANGWWGDDPPFRHPVFVLTHHEREALALGETTFHFVTEGPEVALERAREAAGDADVQVAGGADAIQQYLRLGHLEELQLSVAPILLGGGTRLLADLGDDPPSLERVAAVESPSGAVHLRYRVAG